MAETLVLIMVYVVAAGFVVLAYRWPGAALITSLVVLVAVATFAAVMDYSGSGSFPLAVFLGPVAAVCLFRGSPDAGRWPHTTAKWTLIVLAALLAAVIGIGMSGILAPLWAVILVGAILRFVLLSRRAVTHYVVSTISACVRQNMPLTSALAAAVEGRTGKRARMLGRIGFMLSQGRPLSEAIRRGYHACPGHVVATVEAAERIDRLPQALRCLEADMLRGASERRRLKPFPVWYPLAVLVLVYTVLSSTAIWIIPSFERIFQDWGRPLP
ncbi:MAG: type II secretion system F family protein, partial [Phycisphaerae bacterium]